MLRAVPLRRLPPHAPRRCSSDLGGFDENIFLFYEDDDLCRRIADAPGPDLCAGRRGPARPRALDRAEAGRMFKSRWHQAWSRAYVPANTACRPAPGMFALNGVKTALACSASAAAVERYAGSAAGALAFLRGRTALAQEGLGEGAA